ncbi:hypothetical protein CEXT_804881 [Caerostris extrusa]|uniref:Uncharacterized protein n=1 Tax=Caerostris extrusa TaxID=172846 RepID=A0AAV4MP71_CAEEX|nr:hypothetical protein CEXT_804881 [Caerostris extrusa]
MIETFSAGIIYSGGLVVRESPKPNCSPEDEHVPSSHAQSFDLWLRKSPLPQPLITRPPSLEDPISASVDANDFLPIVALLTICDSRTTPNVMGSRKVVVPCCT